MKTTSAQGGDPRANERVKQALDIAIADHGEIGIQVAAYKDGQLVVDTWTGRTGRTGRAGCSNTVDGDTLFNVFSVTKAVAVTAIHIQAERGLIEYDAPIADYWPEFAVNGKEAATVRHALTHRAGVPQMPAGTSPEMMCDWDAMASAIAKLTPRFEIGGAPAYHCITLGWILGELVRRTDAKGRGLNQFVQEELCHPLGIQDLWLGIPDEAEHRIATLTNGNADDPKPDADSEFVRSVPLNVQLVPEVFERADVRRACIPAVGGIFNARSEGRFWALLANGGVLDGVRLLSKERVTGFNTPRAQNDLPDPVYLGMPMPMSEAGYWLGVAMPPLAAVKNPQAICCPGAGGSIGWADQENNIAVAICHNRMLNKRGSLDHPLVPVADAIRQALGME